MSQSGVQCPLHTTSLHWAATGETGRVLLLHMRNAETRAPLPIQGLDTLFSYCSTQHSLESAAEGPRELLLHIMIQNYRALADLRVARSY